jgi:hypothetical protein
MTTTWRPWVLPDRARLTTQGPSSVTERKSYIAGILVAKAEAVGIPSLRTNKKTRYLGG